MMRWQGDYQRLPPQVARAMYGVIDLVQSQLLLDETNKDESLLDGLDFLDECGINVHQAMRFLRQFAERFLTARFVKGGYDLRSDLTAPYEYFLHRCIRYWFVEAWNLYHDQGYDEYRGQDWGEQQLRLLYESFVELRRAGADDEEDGGDYEDPMDRLTNESDFETAPKGEDDFQLWSDALEDLSEVYFFWDADYLEYPKIRKNPKSAETWKNEDFLERLNIAKDYYEDAPAVSTTEFKHNESFVTRSFEDLLPIAKRVAARKILRFIVRTFGSTANLHHHMNRGEGPIANREFLRAKECLPDIVL